MKAVEWIDRVKAAKGWESDYRAAQELGITRGGMSQIRTGDTETLREETAVKVAEFLGVDPAAIVLDQVAEKSKNEAVRAALQRVAHDLCILCKVTDAALSKAAEALAPLFFPGVKSSRGRTV